jgi:hypothetical protein
VSNFKKGEALQQAEAIEILKRNCDNIVPIDNLQDQIEFYWTSENSLVIQNTVYGLSFTAIYNLHSIKSTVMCYLQNSRNSLFWTLCKMKFKIGTLWNEIFVYPVPHLIQIIQECLASKDSGKHNFPRHIQAVLI